MTSDQTAEQILADAMHKCGGWCPFDCPTRPVARSHAESSVAALRAAGLLPGPDDIVVNREDLDHYMRSTVRDPYSMAGDHRQVTARLRAALSQSHPKETPKVYPSGTRRPGVYLSPDPAPQPHPAQEQQT